jgi:CRISPR system Cascade subunit CasE
MSPTATLARIQVNPLSRAVQRDLRDAAQMHKTLMRMLPDDLGDSPRHDTGLLYRIEENDDTSTLLVQASTPLDHTRLPADYGRTTLKDLTPMFGALRTGTNLRYRIVLNPAKRQRLPLEDKNQRGKVIPLTGADADQWWNRRATEAGLHLTTALPTPVTFAHPRSTGTAAIRHSLLRYDGTATVTDPDALIRAVLAGIGRGKPYGAGMLSLAPAH